MSDPSNDYESGELLSQYLIFHYGTTEDRMPWKFGPRLTESFPESCVRLLLEAGLRPDGRALDVGCAVGAAAYVLSRSMSAVRAVDTSQSFTAAAERIGREGRHPVDLIFSGDISRRIDVVLPVGAQPERVRFETGDAHALPEAWCDFDAVLACNLLCRMARPAAFLEQLPHLVRPGGLLLLTTPGTWLESCTPREFWIGATPERGAPLEALKAALGDDFTLEQRVDQPFCIREHLRKYQWSVAEATLWRRKT